jgi:hypothetical protein
MRCLIEFFIESVEKKWEILTISDSVVQNIVTLLYVKDEYKISSLWSTLPTSRLISKKLHTTTLELIAKPSLGMMRARFAKVDRVHIPNFWISTVTITPPV